MESALLASLAMECRKGKVFGTRKKCLIGLLAAAESCRAASSRLETSVRRSGIPRQS